MLGTSERTFCPLSKLWRKSPHTDFLGPERERFLYKVELRTCALNFRQWTIIKFAHFEIADF